MDSKTFRKSSLFLRNEFQPDGMFGFSLVRKQEISLNSVELIACSDTRTNDRYNTYKGVHFFTDDYRFCGIYDHPDRSLEKFRQYRFVLTPDFSLYAEMEPWRQIESVGKSRWIGAYWQSQGLTVIPTVSWAKPSSFRYCFDGIEKTSVVAVGMIGCKHERIAFMKGYNAMLDKIEPSAIICFGTPFPEMCGNIIAVDYLSSRKVMRS